MMTTASCVLYECTTMAAVITPNIGACVSFYERYSERPSCSDTVGFV
jgi:hypothetical protein